LLVACSKTQENVEQPLAGDASFASVQKFILSPKCMSCHTGPASPKGVDLSTYAAVLREVTPGNPEASPLYLSVTVGSMPKNGTRLSTPELDLLRQWILAGALEGAAPPPPAPPAAEYRWIQANVLDTRCIGCHDGKHEKTKLDLRSYETLMAFSGEFLMAVEPGDPDLSLLYRVLNEGTMPPATAGKKIAQEAIAAIGQWITDGAIQN